MPFKKFEIRGGFSIKATQSQNRPLIFATLACLNPVVLGAIVVAGAVSVAVGSSEMVESFTGHNTVRDDVLQGNTQAYEVVRTVSSTVTAAANLVSSITTVCFVAGTWILTNNTLTEIEKIEVGDKVWAENPETGQKELGHRGRFSVLTKSNRIC